MAEQTPSLWSYGSPEAYRIAQQAAIQKAASEYAQKTQQQRTDEAGYMAGAGLRGGLNSLFGVEDQGLQQVKQFQEIMRDVDRQNPESIFAAAKKLQDINHPAFEQVLAVGESVAAKKSKLADEAATTAANIEKAKRETALAERALADARRLSREEGFKNLPPEVQTILLMEQRDPEFDAKKAMQDYLNKKGAKQVSEPYQRGGAWVQRDLVTGEEKQIVPRAPVTNVNAGLTKAERAAEKKAEARQAEINMADNNSYRASNAMQTAKEALDLVSWKTAGTGGKVFSFIPGSDAVALREKAKTLEGILSFAELAKMRQESKTGGALGSIAVKELELLGKTVASLSQDVSPDELAKNIQKIYTHLEKYKETMDRIASGGEQNTPKQTQTRKTKSGVTYTVEE